jgi:hypothetical protein
MIRETEAVTGKQMPLILFLLGGYRKDDHNPVLSLHTAVLVACLNILCGCEIDYIPEVTVRKTS